MPKQVALLEAQLLLSKSSCVPTDKNFVYDQVNRFFIQLLCCTVVLHSSREPVLHICEELLFLVNNIRMWDSGMERKKKGRWKLQFSNALALIRARLALFQ